MAETCPLVNISYQQFNPIGGDMTRNSFGLFDQAVPGKPESKTMSLRDVVRYLSEGKMFLMTPEEAETNGFLNPYFRQMDTSLGLEVV
jgi:hypothetical protein